EESSDSDGETEPARCFLRRLSTKKEIERLTSIKEGYLHKQNSSFQRLVKRYFKLHAGSLYYSTDNKSTIFNQIALIDTTIAECSLKNINHSFQVITPSRNLIICADSRREMEEWMGAIRSAVARDISPPALNMTLQRHNWCVLPTIRPTFCNVCGESLQSVSRSGVTLHGLACEVCKYRTHKRCAIKSHPTCKWSTLASMEHSIVEDAEGNLLMPHQWQMGNFPANSKCLVCKKSCGSMLRLQDLSCLWCQATVHSGCQHKTPTCNLGPAHVSILPPTSITMMDEGGFWRAQKPSDSSPLLVFLNSKSGDSQGVKMLRRFKQLLNPAQVFDLMNGGPRTGLRLFQNFQTFRVLVCGGDGSMGWVLNEIDKLGLHGQCQLGILPLGTGNDLSRVLGWGASFDDDTQLSLMLERLERAQIQMFDRFVQCVCNLSLSVSCSATKPTPDIQEAFQLIEPIVAFEDTAADHLSRILHSQSHNVVISSAMVLCSIVQEIVSKVASTIEVLEGGTTSDDSLAYKCMMLNDKMDALLKTLAKESSLEQGLIESKNCSKQQHHSDKQLDHSQPDQQTAYRSKEQLMCRANSLKKAIRNIVEVTERTVDEQNHQTICFNMENYKRSLMNKSPSSSPSPIPLTKPNVENLTFTSPTIRSSPGNIPTATSVATINDDSAQAATASQQNEVIYGDAGTTCTCGGGSHGGSKDLSFPLLNVPLLHSQPSRDDFYEKCVMNNYLGVGLDAKIALDFHNKREEQPHKCRSRTRNMMWYGVLGGKEILQRTHKNLDQRVRLECDGKLIPLPNLQGIVVLNIPSYMGGTNFWGGSKGDEFFLPPSIDDKILEVVAVFGSIQLGISRVINLQRHRIAQCHSVRITIIGDEKMPVQVDGEAWLQNPGVIWIQHKNRAQVLIRHRAFEETHKTWTERNK
ncbi:hypothetical protein HELRODRAFT_128981, partial [Helobdella robusta]|uniref:Diacylglycerol kinase n=1 Tax=Helobdella robusta TaxID=6412 RepID=T1EHR0_HELRO